MTKAMIAQQFIDLFNQLMLLLLFLLLNDNVIPSEVFLSI